MKIAALLLAVSCSLAAFAQKTRDFRKEALMLRGVLEQHHYQPKALDDRFGKLVLREILERLDPDHMLFTRREVAELERVSAAFDNELAGEGWTFFNALKDIYQRSLERSAVAATTLLSAPLNFRIQEYYVPDSRRWLADEDSLIHHWRRYLKYKTLERLAAMASARAVNGEYPARYEEEARQRVLASQLRHVNRILKHPAGFEAYFAIRFFQGITAVFDPHTSYLSATDMENFIAMLSTEGYYFGFTLAENERGEVVIAFLAPGGPAWRSGELNQGDALIGLEWENEEAYDLGGVSTEEVSEIIADANHKAIALTVRKSDGLVRTVKLRKAKIAAEDSYVRSFVLRGDTDIGYISLPDFYTRWGSSVEGSHSASDVAKEILKLKKENIKGLILDIRYNGGGSLYEAIALAGIFIDEGTLGFLKGRDQVAIPLKDINRGTVYDGPLLVLVNGQSASASELLAAALQDYRRAIIAGSTSFGKATAQNIFPLDRPKDVNTTFASIRNDIGYSSITIERLYRATGKSAQGKGVTPDILLPDIFEAIKHHESDLRHAFPIDSLDRKISIRTLSPLPLDRLRRNSAARVDTSALFAEVRELCNRMAENEMQRQAPVALTWPAAQARYQAGTERSRALRKTMSVPRKAYTVASNSTDLLRNSVDEYARELNNQWAARLQNDIYLEEAYYIMSDYLSLLKKP